MSRQLGELLLKDKLITPQQFQEAVTAAQSTTTKSVIRALLERKYIAENKLLYYLSQKFALPSVNLAKFEIKPEVLKMIPADLARKNQIIPIQVNPGTLVVALCDPTNISHLEDIKFRLKMNVEAVLTSYSIFDQVMGKHYSGVAASAAILDQMKTTTVQYGGGGSRDSNREENKNEDTGPGIDEIVAHQIDSGASEHDAPVIRLVNSVFSEAVRRGASDIHVEPYEKRFRVRLRIDGTLHQIVELPLDSKRAIIARFKIMARLDTTETRVPQDGRIKLKLGDSEVDFRVNTMPTLFGEKIVLRMLNKGSLMLDLTKCGMEPKQLDIFKKGIYAANGMVLVTGPTGSGKTTTLYSALAELNQITDNLSTAEDPVEYNLEGINQVQINKEVGLTFASVLRALLRQDPDTVLVGEIRDYETAEVAIQAALTGHLVLSTLHTNDAPSTVTRLLNMGVEPFLVCASLNTIVAQRLLRTICPHCKQETPTPIERLTQLGIRPDIVSQLKLFKGKGCSQCNNSGYKGRAAVYEVMGFSDQLKELVLKGESMIAIKKQAMAEGMQSLRQSAINRVIEGRTTLEEALSMTMEG